MVKNRLYITICIVCFFGFCYLLYGFFFAQYFTPRLCIFKNVTGYPCPSCGVTRAIFLLLEGEITKSLMMNPLGFVAALIMLIVPLWLLNDFLTKKETFYTFYKKTESVISIRWIAAVLTVLIILNWMWNINKGL